MRTWAGYQENHCHLTDLGGCEGCAGGCESGRALMAVCPIPGSGLGEVLADGVGWAVAWGEVGS